MINIVLNVCYIILSILGLGFGGSIFVSSASSFAKRLKISQFLIGVVIVGFGTSLPEFFVSFLAAFRGEQNIAVGNIFGSNIVNILIIFGLTSFIYPVSLENKSLSRSYIYLFLTQCLLFVFMLDFRDIPPHSNFTLKDIMKSFGHESSINRVEGFIMFILLVLYVIISYYRDKRKYTEQLEIDDAYKNKSVFFIILMLSIGLGIIIICSNILIVGSKYLALNVFKVSERVVSITIVAIGTSIPELSSSVVASFKKQNDISVGNIIGSNIFNILFGLGFTSIFREIKIFDTKFLIDYYIMFTAFIILVLSGFFFKKVGRLLGVIYLLIYSTYFYFFIFK